MEITVKRYDNKRTGTYECYYYRDGRKIAEYYSKTDTIYRDSRLINKDLKRPIYDRALSGKYAEAYRQLFDMLNIDSTSTMSEYIDL